MFVVSFLYKKVSELTMASTKEIPLKDVAGHENNVKVFLEFGISDRFKDDIIGRVELELFTNKLPVTTENFLLHGGKRRGRRERQRMHYKGVKCHRIIPGFMLQGGDHIQGDGSGGESIYGRCFADEWPDGGHVKHQKGGLLSMANSGPGTNGSQFFLTFAKAKWLDGPRGVRAGHERHGAPALDRDALRDVHRPAPTERHHQGLRRNQGEEHVTRRRARRGREYG